MSEKLTALKDHLATLLGAKLLSAEIALGELCIRVEPSQIETVLWVLRDDKECVFSQLLDITAVDYPGRTPRFDVVYQLLSLRQNLRVKVKLATEADTPVPTVIHVYPSAGWYEREAWDMYGILFAGHPDLRRILTDYGFDGHPLRKDFPLTGFVELRYDEEKKAVVYEPVKLNQAFRTFDFESPWEGMEKVAGNR